MNNCAFRRANVDWKPAIKCPLTKVARRGVNEMKTKANESYRGRGRNLLSSSIRQWRRQAVQKALFLREAAHKWRRLLTDQNLRQSQKWKRTGGRKRNNVFADPFVSRFATKGGQPVVSAVRRQHKGTQPDRKDNQSLPQSIVGIAFCPWILWLISPARQDTKTPIAGQISPVWVGFTDVCTGLVIRRRP